MERSLGARLRELEDREQIQELRAQYCFLVDDGRYDELVDRWFTEDARCDFRSTDGSMGPLRSNGREEVRRFFQQTVASSLRDMSHTVHNHRIRIDGDEAEGDCYFELTAVDIPTGEPVVGAGRYVDRYRRTNGHWRFAERNAEIFHIVPLSEGWAKRRFLPTVRQSA